MVKPEEFEITFSNPRRVYLAGDTVTGSLLLQLKDEDATRRRGRSDGLRLRFSGKADVAFTRGSGKTKQHFFASERYFEKYVDIYPQEGITAGHHDFPFTFKLPLGIPSSFECHYGSVRYAVKAYLTLRGSSVIVKRHYAVFLPKNIDEEIYSRHPAVNEEEVTMCCCGGAIEARISLQKSAFVPGETISAKVEITNNTNSRIKKLILAVEQVYHCHANGDTQTFSKLIGSKPYAEHAGIASGTSVIWNAEDVKCPVTVPTNLPGCGIIDILHRLVLHCDMGTCTCDRIAAAVPITIGTHSAELALRSDAAAAANAETFSSGPQGQSYSENHDTRGEQGQVHSYDNDGRDVQGQAYSYNHDRGQGYSENRRGVQGQAYSENHDRRGAQGQAYSENHDRRGAQGQAYSENHDRRGAQGQAYSEDYDGRGAQGQVYSEEYDGRGAQGQAYSENHGRRGAHGQEYSENHGRRGAQGQGYSENHGRRGAHGQAYSENHGRRGAQGQEYSENHGRRGAQGQAYSEDYGGRGVPGQVYPESESRRGGQLQRYSEGRQEQEREANLPSRRHADTPSHADHRPESDSETKGLQAIREMWKNLTEEESLLKPKVQGDPK